MTTIDLAGGETPLDLRAETGLGSWLLLLRTRAALTQAELAQAAGVSQRNIQRWESEQNAPGGYELLRVLDALGVRLGEFAPAASVNTELRDLRDSISRAFNPVEWTGLEAAVVGAVSEGQTYEQIATVRGISVTKTKEAFHSAIQKLADANGLGSVFPHGGPPEVVRRLDALEAKVSALPTAQDLGQATATLQAAIDRLANRGSRGVQPAKPAGKRGAK